jgi:hypothetical protein
MYEPSVGHGLMPLAFVAALPLLAGILKFFTKS